MGERSEPIGSLRREKGGASLSPSPGHPSAHFLRRYFSFLTPFFAFFPHCGAWSQVNDSYAMKLEKLPLNDKITASCLQHIIVNYKQQKRNFEKLLGQQVFQSHNWNPFQSSSSLFIPGFFCNCCTFIPSSNCVWAVILKFYLIRYPEYQRFFLACSEELCRPQAEDTSVTETENRARKASCT